MAEYIYNSKALWKGVCVYGNYYLHREIIFPKYITIASHYGKVCVSEETIIYLGKLIFT